MALAAIPAVETSDPRPHPAARLAGLPFPAYCRAVKILLVSILAIACSTLSGCTGKKQKSGYRTYEGDSSPGIKIFEEKPGYPLNSR